jgi:hypothetical protein
MSYIILRGRWCDILNVYAPTEDSINDMKHSFYDELEFTFDKFLKYHTKFFLGDFNAKLDKEDVFKSTIRNENLHEISNDNAVTVVNFATSKNLIVNSTVFSTRSVQRGYKEDNWGTESVLCGSCGEKGQKEKGSRKGADIQRGLEPESRRLTMLRSRYQAITNEDTRG